MLTNVFNSIWNVLHARFCYQIFITPIHIPLEKKYRVFSKLACEFMVANRTEVIHQITPRHHVLHRFTPINNPKNKKILITHGWISRAAYMVRLIKNLYEQGYEVYALDFPAHGEAKGWRLPWPDAVAILHKTINQFGPFYSVIGHSFGGSMLLNTLNLANQLPNWRLIKKPQRVVLIASPIHMRHPVTSIARRFKLSSYGYLHLRQLIRQQTSINLKLIRLRHFMTKTPELPFLCIHGKQDTTVKPQESIDFCKQYKNATLALLEHADHVSVLMDDRVEQLVSDFLEQE